ncbi:hypothetical protein EXIGLDRAFT_719006 [Exidia glandulosa HHB12029]|uniref:F-box domain-containing protein n=1 Tax=Exidia glandulosa HHB12029 TaxID=1314781 RepID=A0A165NV10_EXIGL|nr:hypothetical protein EXIGLDRAFT_719006 [Exidia glandulosa HHB12029]
MGEVHDLDAERLPFLPKDILSEVFSLLLPVDLVNLAGTCNTIRQFLLLPSSKSIWTRAHANKAVIDLNPPPVPEVPPGAHPYLLLLRDKYYDLIDQQHAPIRLEFPPFRDLAALHGVRKRLDAATTDEQVLGVAQWLVNAVQAWRTRAQTELVALLPKNVKAYQKPLQLAAAIYRRGGDPRPLVYPDMLMGDPYTIKDPTRSGPDGELKYNTSSTALVRKMCETAGLNVSSTTQAQLDASRVRFCCLTCEPDWALVMNWRQFLEHANAEHDGQDVMLAKWPPNTAERAVVVEGTAALWTCLKCPSSKQGLYTRPAVRHHVTLRHDIAQPIEGIQFSRSPLEAVPKPLNILQLHAEKVLCTVLDDDDEGSDGPQTLWKCQHCALALEGIDALDMLEGHLGTAHGVLMRLPRALPVVDEHPQQDVLDSLNHFALAAATGDAAAFEYAFQTAAFMPPQNAPQPDEKTIPTLTNGVVKASQPAATYTIMLQNGGKGKVRIQQSLEKIFGCAHCSGNAKMKSRAFELQGIKMHLFSKHKLADPVLDMDFFVRNGPALYSPLITLLPDT